VFPSETNRVKGNGKGTGSPWLHRAEDARLELLQPQRAAPSLELSCRESFQRGHLPGAAVPLNFTLSSLKQTRKQTEQTKATSIK